MSMNNIFKALSNGFEIVDLTAPLSSDTPTLQLPEPLKNTPKFEMTLLSNFDEPGPLTYWNAIVTGEHTGTHLDAPNHWVSGRGGEDVASISLDRLVAPLVVIDKTAEVENDPNYLLNDDDLDQWISEHGELPEGGWLLFRTGWSSRAKDPVAFRNEADGHPNTPGITASASKRLAEETGIVGYGVETVGTDAGLAASFDPPFPLHHYMLGNGKYGVTQLKNLDKLPATGGLIVVAPLPIVEGSGSPVRAFAIIPN